MKIDSPLLQWPDIENQISQQVDASELVRPTYFDLLTTRGYWPQEHPSEPLRAELGFLQGIMQAPWWPAGLGVLLDDGEHRFAVVPHRGAGRYLRMERDDRRWRSALDFAFRPANGASFLFALLHSLRAEVAGLAPARQRDLPSHPQDLRDELRRIGPEATSNPPSTTIQLLRRTDHRILPSELLEPWHSMPVSREVRHCVSALKGEVARALGAFIDVRWNDPTHGVLRREPFDALQHLMTNSPRPTSWTLQVDAEGSDVELLIARDGEVRTIGSVMSLRLQNEPPMLVRLDPADDLGCAMQSLARRLGGEICNLDPVVATARGAGRLSKVTDAGRIHLLGHGSRRDAWVDREGGFTITKMGGRSARELAQRLVTEGLPRSFCGTIYLEGCQGGSGNLRKDVYARALRDALAALGWTGVTVAGRPGETAIFEDASMTLPEAVAYEIETTMAHASADVRRTRAGDGDATESLARAREWHAVVKRAMEVMNGSANGAVSKMDALAVRDAWARFGPASPVRRGIGSSV